MLKKLLLAATALLVSAPALADGGHWQARHHWKQWNHHRHGAPVLVVPAPRVFYAPPPRVIYAPPPAPVYYAPPPVVYPAPVHVPASGVSIRLHFPL
jgi:hypothetical protein